MGGGETGVSYNDHTIYISNTLVRKKISKHEQQIFFSFKSFTVFSRLWYSIMESLMTSSFPQDQNYLEAKASTFSNQNRNLFKTFWWSCCSSRVYGSPTSCTASSPPGQSSASPPPPSCSPECPASSSPRSGDSSSRASSLFSQASPAIPETN